MTDRVRLGLTGLAAILAIVFVASSAMRSDTNDLAPQTAGETLSVIGVAPKMDKHSAPVAPPTPPTPAERETR